MDFIRVCLWPGHEVNISAPLIGYLLAGFVLHFAGVTPDDTLHTLADLGITLMLFTIGLKLDIRSLLKAEVWAGALSHMGIWMVLFLGSPLALGRSPCRSFQTLPGKVPRCWLSC
ncbi:cation:proton antiporter domain-containing protein [Aliamphritea spongicola]|nr:cation:proton antiporter [Aliamphritea spongicola]